MTKKSKNDYSKLEKKIFNIVNDAAEAILEGVQAMFDEQDKKNDAKFATKEDLKYFATKEDLKRETGFIRQDINDLRAEISTMPTRNEFERLKRSVAHLTS